MSKTPPNRDSEGAISCPDCGGALWDNREKKANGSFSAKSPDFSCKDKDGCNYGFWLESKGGGGGGKKKGGGAKRSGSGAPDGPPLARALYEAYLVARDVVGQLRGADIELMGDEMTVPDVANTLFRAHVESGRPIKAPEPAPQPKPEPKPEPQTGEQDLPF